jgi:hypothetical protein
MTQQSTKATETLSANTQLIGFSLYQQGMYESSIPSFGKWHNGSG